MKYLYLQLQAVFLLRWEAKESRPHHFLSNGNPFHSSSRMVQEFTMWCTTEGQMAKEGSSGKKSEILRHMLWLALISIRSMRFDYKLPMLKGLDPKVRQCLAIQGRKVENSKFRRAKGIRLTTESIVNDSYFLPFDTKVVILSSSSRINVSGKLQLSCKYSERFDSYVPAHTKVNAVNFCIAKKRAAEQFHRLARQHVKSI